MSIPSSTLSPLSVRDDVVSLAGAWRFSQRDSDPAGQWNDTIHLPGTTATEAKGPDNGERSLSALSQPHLIVGSCWYERDVTIPDGWDGKRVFLVLERTKFTRVWFDGRLVGEQPWICTPHEYLLTDAAVPGAHRLTIQVDNRRIPPFGSDAHQVSPNTQGNWNGVLGRIELQAKDAVSIADVQVYPDGQNRTARVVVTLCNAGEPVSAHLEVRTTGPGVSSADAVTSVCRTLPGGDTVVELVLHLGDQAALWDEFHPKRIRLAVALEAGDSRDRREISFGLRDFIAAGRHFEVNGRPIFLRGRHDACVFPLTGHPPMDVAGWRSYFLTCREYGLNHVRFHTWTPPEAAFEAADELGFYLQPELPYWGDFDEKAVEALQPEAARILRAYGNHPSFVMFSMGNEHWGDPRHVDGLIHSLRSEDARRVYVRGSAAFWAEGRPGPHDQYLVASDAKAEDGTWYQIRGANAGPKPGHAQRGVANTLTDYQAAAEANDAPTVTHEMGQYTVYPDFAEIRKYTGATKPYNLMAFRERLAKAGMLDQNRAFALASGRLAALCYREEIEACLRTPEYGGFELLDLQDFPGQGTALIGMLDAFMDSKGVITPAEWREFCAPTVLLARFPRYVWSAGEVCTVRLQLSHFGDRDIPAGRLLWRLEDASGNRVASGTLSHPGAVCGALAEIGVLDIPLRQTGHLQLHLALDGTDVRTHYSLWVYPTQEDVPIPDGLVLSRRFDAAAREALAEGKRVVLVCDARQPLLRSVGGGFAPDFWNFPMFHGKPGTMGLLCDPRHPALAAFPNKGRSDWQWAAIALASQPLILDTVLPSGKTPIVQTIDNYARCHKLGLIFELVVGAGKLLVCTADLTQLQADHPEARALLGSLLNYAASSDFRPTVNVSAEALDDLLRVRLDAQGWVATASSHDSGWQGYGPERIFDGNEASGWKAAGAGPAWCRIDFPAPLELSGAEVLWDRPGYRYALEASADGDSWETLVDEREAPCGTARRPLSFHADGVKSLRISVEPPNDDLPALLMAVSLFGPDGAPPVLSRVDAHVR